MSGRTSAARGARSGAARASAFRAAALAAVLAALLPSAGCIPLMVGAAVGGGALVATDRRSPSAQLDDEEVEFKFGVAATNRYGEGIHAIATSYNGKVLLTGQVPDAATREGVEAIARGLPHVRAVENELEIGPATTLAERTKDGYTTSVVKARMIDDRRVPAARVKVVTERGVVYLMGIVSREEGEAAAEVASTSPNVVRVVKVFEYTEPA